MATSTAARERAQVLAAERQAIVNTLRDDLAVALGCEPHRVYQTATKLRRMAAEAGGTAVDLAEAFIAARKAQPSLKVSAAAVQAARTRASRRA